MNIFKKIFLFLILLNVNGVVFSMEKRNRDLEDRIKKLQKISDDYGSDSSNDEGELNEELSDFDEDYQEPDSDSEDENKYTYRGFNKLNIPETMNGKKCVLLFRGINYLLNSIDKKQRSELRHKDSSGMPIYCSAGINMSLNYSKQRSRIIKKRICNLSKEERDIFQEKFSNSYNGFHNSLKEPEKAKLRNLSISHIFRKFKNDGIVYNPLIACSESIEHALKYAFGLKNYGKNSQPITPNYDKNGNPDHPYIGKIYVILIPIDEIDRLDPYFVVYSHVCQDIKIRDDYRNNILSEREVALPGFVPGRYVIGCQNVRVPSFAWEKMPKFYNEKYNIENKQYKNRQTRHENKTGNLESIIERNLIPYLSEEYQKYIQEQLKECEIEIVYKSLDGDFDDKFIDLPRN